MLTIDNYSLWEEHDREQELALRRKPVCDRCGEYIQQEYAVRIGVFWYCDDCLDDMRMPTEE